MYGMSLDCERLKNTNTNSAQSATIQAGATGDVAKAMLIWALPGALIQLLGGPSRQLGILLATGLLGPGDRRRVGALDDDILTREFL